MIRTVSRRGARPFCTAAAVQVATALQASGACCCSTTNAAPTWIAPSGARRFFAKGGPVEGNDETHPDFQPQPVSNTEADTEEIKAIKEDILATIRDEPIVLFIKGSPEAPVCGFSKRVVDLLDALSVEYTSFDVLAHPTVRSYVKEVSQWPTIPQLFIKGEFFGGQDIIFQQAQNGQLQMALERAEIPYRQLKL